MPTYSERPDLAESLFDDLEAGSQAGRDAKGNHPHASALGYCLRQGWVAMHFADPLTKQLHRGPVTSDDDKFSMARFLGSVLHLAMTLAQKPGRRVNVPLEYHITGSDVKIVGEADAILADGTIEDNKTTRKSACATKKRIGGYSPADDPQYVEQIATYLVMNDKDGFAHSQIYKAVLHILFLVGCYGADPFPRLRSWVFNFERSWLLKWRTEMERRAKILAGPDLPGLDDHYEWECDLCPLFEKRGGFCPGGPGRLAGFFPLDKEAASLQEDEHYDLRSEQDREGGLPSTDPRVLVGNLPPSASPGFRDV